MSETHAPVWIRDRGNVSLEFAPSPLNPHVDYSPFDTSGWELVTVDVPHLMTVKGQKKRVGAKLVEITSP
jgi:hypothetical protein